MKLILIRGLPGSGKSTLASILAKSIGAKHYEADQYFIQEDGSYKWSADKIRHAHEWCQKSTLNELTLGNSVIVSNTFTTKSELQPYLEIAKQFNIVPTVILMQNEYGSIHDVPNSTIEKMKNRFQYDIKI